MNNADPIDQLRADLIRQDRVDRSFRVLRIIVVRLFDFFRSFTRKEGKQHE